MDFLPTLRDLHTLKRVSGSKNVNHCIQPKTKGVSCEFGLLGSFFLKQQLGSENCPVPTQRQLVFERGVPICSLSFPPLILL